MSGNILYIVSQAPESGYEDKFEEWYDHEHIPELLGCPGFLSAKRFVLVEGMDAAPKYLASYEVSEMAAFSSEQYLRQLNRPADQMSPLEREVRSHRIVHFTAKYRSAPQALSKQAGTSP